MKARKPAGDLRYMLCGRDSNGNVKRKRYGSLKQAKNAAKNSFWSEISIWQLIEDEDLTKENYVLKPNS